MQPDRPTEVPFGWADKFFTFGITGTNGKTSTTFMVQSIVRASGHSCLLIGTTGYWLDETKLDDLPRTLSGFHDAFRRADAVGARWAACECTSHGLAEGYAKRWRFDLGVFTNLSPDHLKTHGTWEHYLASKAQLFVHLGPGKSAVLNAADVHAVMIDRATPPDVRKRWFHAPARGPALVEPDLAATKVELDASGTRIVLAPGLLAERLGGALQLRMVGDVYAENALAAALAGEAAGLPDEAIVRGLAECPQVPGRFEVLHTDPIVAVDYAHSHDALVRTCASARRLARGRVIVVFGAGGESTPEKRGPMGEAVGAAADLAIVTNDNPRREDPRVIAAAVADGVRRGGHAQLVTELDRTRAIERALEEAKSGDVVIIAGKGHEQGQAQGGAILPFSDTDVVRRILGARVNEAIGEVIAAVRRALLASYGWTHVDVELAELRGDTAVLHGVVAAPRAIARLRAAIARALPELRVDTEAIAILRSDDFVDLPDGTTELWRRPDRERPDELATCLVAADGPVEALAALEGATLVRALDGTLGWTRAALGPRCGPPRLCDAGELAPEQLPALARAWLDAPYKLGGTLPDGVDCSGLVQRLLGSIGALVPRHSADQLAIASHDGAGPGTPGDIVALWSSDEAPCHVGLAIGDGAIVHASRSRGCVVIDELEHWQRNAERLAHTPLEAVAELQRRAAGHRGLGDVLTLGRDA